jgi:hypothetical protein
LRQLNDHSCTLNGLMAWLFVFNGLWFHVGVQFKQSPTPPVQDSVNKALNSKGNPNKSGRYTFMRSLKFRASALVLALALVFDTVACSTNWVSEALSIIAALTPAVANIVPLVMLADKNIDPNAANTILNYSNQASSALQEVAGLIDQYNKATADQQPDLLAKIQAILSVGQQNLNAILPIIRISDPKSQAAISQAVAVAINEVASLEALLPVLRAGRTRDAVRLSKPLTADQFRARYNKAIGPIPGSKALRLKGRVFVWRSRQRYRGKLFVSLTPVSRRYYFPMCGTCGAPGHVESACPLRRLEERKVALAAPSKRVVDQTLYLIERATFASTEVADIQQAWGIRNA